MRLMWEGVVMVVEICLLCLGSRVRALNIDKDSKSFEFCVLGGCKTPMFS